MSDVVVIGGGIVGCAVSAHLADRGRRVVLIERSAIAAGASGRNSGVVQHPYDPVLVDLYRQSLELYRQVPPADGVDFVLPDRPAGLLVLSHDEGVVRAEAAALQATLPSVGAEALSPSEVQALEPAIADGVSACRLEIGFPVAPSAATATYAAWARQLGVDIRLGQGARPWLEGGRAAGVRLDDGTTVATDEVIVTAGPWSPALVDPTGAWRPIRSLWGVVTEVQLPDPPGHVLEEADADLEPGLVGAPGTHSFSLVTAGGRSSLGSTFFGTQPDPAAEVPAIVARGMTFLRRLDPARLGAHRVCARPLSLDGRPLVGPVPGVPNLWLAAGHGPWGISTGPAAGPLLAGLLDDPAARTLPALDPSRFGPVPLEG